MKRLVIVYIGFFIALTLVRCSSIGKLTPEYKGVDPKVKDLVDEYKDLAKVQGITFKREVTVGFKDIDNDVIGICNYGENWREIDLDRSFWQQSSNITHLALLFHELDHCKCNRDHDYRGKDYPSPKEIDKQTRDYPSLKEINKQVGEVKLGDFGYYPDKCPKSMMYPYILDDNCTLAHFNDYIEELFENCEPY